MPDPDKKDESLKMPLGDDRPTTPLGPPAAPEAKPSAESRDSTLRAVQQRYDILAELGRGGMGIVYKARDRETGETVALKVLKPEIATRSEVIERFKAELRLARKITHKNVCRTYELLRFEDTVVIAMEYVEGESLRAILERFRGVPWRRGLEWASQICDALREAHAQGIVHRDLKPENIVIDLQGNVKLMDFGIARSFEADATATGSIVGTPAYMSPEQAEGKPADARSDIYSLGLILYEMFTGRAALRAESAVALAAKQIHETPIPPREVEPDLPHRIDRTIQKCLEKNPKKRFQSAADLEAALSEKPEAKLATVAGEGEVLPLHLTRWQPSDWLLTVLAIMGLLIFFRFFDRTSLAPRSKVSFDRSVLRRIAQEYAQRLGAPIRRVSQIDVWPFGDRYDYLAKTAGAPTALELTTNPVPYWVWITEWENGTKVVVNGRGSLAEFYRDFQPSSAIEKFSLEDAKPLAEKALKEFFSRDPALLRLESAANDSWRGHVATTFTWSDLLDCHGLKARYVVTLVGREIASLVSTFDIPAGWATGPVGQDVAWQFLPILALDLMLLVLGLSQRAQVDLAARWRSIVGALVFVCVGLFTSWIFHSVFDTSSLIFFSVLLGLSTAFMAFFMSVAVERSVRRIAPSKLLNFVRLFEGRAGSEPCGLAILRGTLIGLPLLGLDAFLVWLGTSRFGMVLDSFRHTVIEAWVFLRNPWPTAHVLVYTLFQTLSIFLFIPFLASFMARFTRRLWIAMLVAAALSAAIYPGPMFDLGAVQPYPWKVCVLLFDCLVLVWAFNRYDVLTMLAAAFTFAFWWDTYSLLIIFEPTGSAEEWVAFMIWGLFVLGAGAIAFKSSLKQATQRLAAAFE